MRILYYDCFSGISGDMNLAAMIDLGVDSTILINELKKLNVDGWELLIEKDQRHGIFGCKVTVKQSVEDKAHRHLSDISKIIANSNLSTEVKNTSIEIFKLIAKAEAKVHNTTIEKIHFHEVGAIDSIIDIVGAAICYHQLNVDKVIVSRLELGGGFVKCAHGNLPVPAPATSEIVIGIPVSTGGVDFEATTPTGAAILKTLGDSFGKQNKLTVTSTGYGIGHKINEQRPNILRLFIGEELDERNEGDSSVMMECNIDDMNPEWFDTLSSNLLKSGASDVFLTQIIMKKGRPGTKVSVLSHIENIEKIKEILFTHSTTLGLRIIPLEKVSLERKFKKVATPYGEVTMKYGFYKGKKVSSKPEYDECLEIAQRENIPIMDVCRIVQESDKGE
jgi:uncharacterized protein (TIGR00299 family) protein